MPVTMSTMTPSGSASTVGATAGTGQSLTGAMRARFGRRSPSRRYGGGVIPPNPAEPRVGVAGGNNGHVRARARRMDRFVRLPRGARPGSKAAGLAMAFKLIEAAHARWRAVNAPHLVALVRAGAAFKNGKLVERPGRATRARDEAA